MTKFYPSQKEILLNDDGSVRVSTSDSSETADIDASGADAVSNTKDTQATTARISGFNGTTWDRIRTSIVSAVSTPFAGLLNVLGMGRYNATPPTLTDGQAVIIQLDVNGNIKITPATVYDKMNDSVTIYPKSKYLSVISKTTAVTIGGGAASDTLLVGLIITAALTGTCAITGFVDSDGTAQTITLPAATPAGFKDFGDTINQAGALTITCSNAADDNLVSAVWLAA